VRDRAKSFMCSHEGCGKFYTTLHHLKVCQWGVRLVSFNNMIALIR
jgi:hypothetical protein